MQLNVWDELTCSGRLDLGKRVDEEEFFGRRVDLGKIPQMVFLANIQKVK